MKGVGESPQRWRRLGAFRATTAKLDAKQRNHQVELTAKLRRTDGIQNSVSPKVFFPASRSRPLNSRFLLGASVLHLMLHVPPSAGSSLGRNVAAAKRNNTFIHQPSFTLSVQMDDSFLYIFY